MAIRLSNNTLRSKVSLYHYTATNSAHTGTAIVGSGTEYPSTFSTSVRCSVQPDEPTGENADFLPGTTRWSVYFRSDPGLVPNDLILWVDNSSTTRYLVVKLVRDMGGVGSDWQAECYERLANPLVS